jgi:hypothetical protein
MNDGAQVNLATDCASYQYMLYFIILKVAGSLAYFSESISAFVTDSGNIGPVIG